MRIVRLLLVAARAPGGAGRLLRAARRGHGRARVLDRRRRSTPAASSTCSAGRACTGCCGSRVWSAALGTLVSLALGLPAAHVLYRRRLPGGTVLRAALLAPFVLPTVVVGVAFRQLLADSGPLGFLGLDGTPVGDHRRAGVLQRLGRDPGRRRRLGVARPAARPRPRPRSGATPAQVLRTVTLPALRPAIVCGGQRGLPLLRHGLRRRAHPRRAALQLGRDRDLPAHHQPPRPAGGGRAVRAAAASW